MSEAHKKIYWLLDKVTETHRSKQPQLADLGFDLEFTEGDLCIESLVQRDSCPYLIISDSMEHNKLKKTISKLVNSPLSFNAFLILSVEEWNAELCEIAALCNFKSLIPLKVADSEWNYRFISSISGAQTQTTPKPVGSISISSEAKLKVPCRIIWANSEYINIESSLLPEPNDVISVSSQVFNTYSKKINKLVVCEVSHEAKLSKHSYSITCKYFDHEVGSSVESLLQSKKIKPVNQITRLLAISNNNDYHADFIEQFDYEGNKLIICKSMSEIPVLAEEFNPHYIILDSQQLEFQTSEHLKANFYPVLDSCKIQVFGSLHQDTKQLLEQGLPSFEVRLFKDISQINKDVLDHQTQSDLSSLGSYYPVPQTEACSFARIAVVASVTELHQEAVAIQTSIKIQQDALIQLQSPLLKKYLNRFIWCKISASDYIQNDKFHSNFYFCDLNSEEKQQLITMMKSQLVNELAKLNSQEATCSWKLLQSTNYDVSGISQFSTQQTMTNHKIPIYKLGLSKAKDKVLQSSLQEWLLLAVIVIATSIIWGAVELNLYKAKQEKITMHKKSLDQSQ